MAKIGRDKTVECTKVIRERNGDHILALRIWNNSDEGLSQLIRTFWVRTRRPSKAHDCSLLIVQGQHLSGRWKGHRLKGGRPDEWLRYNKYGNVILTTVHVEVGMRYRRGRLGPLELTKAIRPVADIPWHEISHVLCNGQNMRGSYNWTTSEESSARCIWIANVDMVGVAHCRLSIYYVVLQVNWLKWRTLGS